MNLVAIARAAGVAVALAAMGTFRVGAAPTVNDFRIENGALKYRNRDFRITAFHVPYVGESAAAFAVRVSTLVRIADVGGNTVCFDLAGFNDGGTQLDPKGVEVVGAFADRVKDQSMGVLVRILGDSTDPAFRRNAVRTAATALKDEGRVAYWIDGPDAPALARAFKTIAPDRLVFAPDGGDAKTTGTLPGAPPKDSVLVTGAIAPKDWANAHMVLPGTPESFRALDVARANPVEMMPWMPDNSILSEEERAEGFVALFNGRNLEGWWAMGSNANGFRVKDGVLEWAEKGGGGLCTRDRYDDFILRLDWKIAKGGNNGIWLRAPRAARASKIGIECQLMGDSDVENPDKGNTGAVYDVLPPTKKAAKPEGEWNTLEIVFEGAHYKCTLNGEVVQDVDFNDHEELKYRLRKGFIVITDHGDYAAFRNIRIKPL